MQNNLNANFFHVFRNDISYIYLWSLQWRLFKSAPGAVVMLHLDSLPPTPRRSQNVPQIMPIAIPALPGDSEQYPSCWTWCPGQMFQISIPQALLKWKTLTFWASSSSVTCIFKCKTWQLLRHAHWLLLHMYICILDILLIICRSTHGLRYTMLYQ